MRTLSPLPALFAGALLAASSAAAQDRPQVGAFGGYTFGSTTEATTFGGNVQTPLGSGLQIVGEFGRLEDVMPSTLGTLIDFTPLDLHLSAWYGEAGVRFTVPGHAQVVRMRRRLAGSPGCIPPSAARGPPIPSSLPPCAFSTEPSRCSAWVRGSRSRVVR